ncbi:interleukin-6 receptor subunit beta-like [Myripristis murdjan]|uniref:interleukin-6 receptor subunit beta-like n=1 Tax=Myripristis murdjan TaxID=586833 RepID=UPI00117643D3|nr:interleukin-6 receptor subunit beta-like [Myripristis murdjan]
MDRRLLTQVTLCIAFCCALPTELLLSPSQPRCVITAYEKMTCHWTPQNNSPSDTVYTLEVNKTSPFMSTPFFSCARISQTHCSSNITSPDRNFCVRVITHSTPEASSPTLCINGMDIVKLRRPVLSDLRSAKVKPRCLELLWHQPKGFAPSRNSICSDSVEYELQYNTDDQPESQTVQGNLGQQQDSKQCKETLEKNKVVRLGGLCSFSPFTQYHVRLRQRYASVLSDWSDWSDQVQSCTGMEAPATAPQLWRSIKPADTPHQRKVTLLWKSPPKSQTACASLWFNVSCQSGNSHNALQTESCLSVTNTSCELILPVTRSSCSLTMSNSAGTSPAARVTLHAPTDTVLRAMKTISVEALSDSTLKVSWSAVNHSSPTGFLIEWESASETASHSLHWQRLSHETSSMVITDLLPEVRYIVSVRPEFGNESGEEISNQTYTRQGVPSTGPRLHVQEQSSSAILLVWEPLPVKQQHGFITKYSLYCQREDNTTNEVYIVPGDKLHYRLSGLSGVYRIHMTAHTVAGEGRPRPPLWVTVVEDYSVRNILFCAVPPLFAVVLLLLIVSSRRRIRQSIWPQVPDPALSSLRAWTSNIGHPKKNFYSEGMEHTSICDALQDEEYC